MSPSTDVLCRPALVLNRSWRPIHVTTVVRALVMLWNDSAKVVDPDDYRPYAWGEWAALPPREGGPRIRAGRAMRMSLWGFSLKSWDPNGCTGS